MSGVVGADNGREVPTVTIPGTSNKRHPTNVTFRVTFQFSVDVEDFVRGDIEISSGGYSASGLIPVDNQNYTLDIGFDPNVERDVTVTVKAGAATNDGDGNARTSRDFAVDSKAPVLEDATVDENKLVLTYHENIEDESDPSPSNFDVVVENVTVTVSAVSVDVDEVTLTLDDDVSRGDDVTIDYTPGSKRPSRTKQVTKRSPSPTNQSKTTPRLPTTSRARPEDWKRPPMAERGSTWSGTSRPTTEADEHHDYDPPATGSRSRTRATTEIGPFWNGFGRRRS